MSSFSSLGELLSTVDLVLIKSDYVRLPTEVHEGWPVGAAAYEDKYSIIGVFAFHSIRALLDTWLDVESLVVDLLTSNIASLSPKSWDGYLVLITPETPTTEFSALTAIRSNTRRLRKLVVTGDDLQSSSLADVSGAVRKALAPLLPVDLERVTPPADPLATLATRVQVRGLSSLDVEAVVSAYRDGQPMIQALHARLNASST